MLERIAEMRRRLAEVAPLLPEAIALHRARLGERLREGNELYYELREHNLHTKTMMVFGDAKKVIEDMVKAVE